MNSKKIKMGYEEIIAELKNKVYRPVYFLMGEESYFIDQISNYIAGHVLSPEKQSFNQHILYGKDTDVKTIITNARRFPMMASHQVVIVREAQNIKKIEDLETYVSKPLKSTILVIDYKYKTIDRRKSFARTLASAGVLFESKKIYENRMPDWVAGYLSEKQYGIDPKASILIADSLGNDLGKVTNELNKLMVILPKGTRITSELVEEHIGISKDFNIFELQDALGEKDVLKANRIISYFAANPAASPLPLTISLLYSFFMKLLIYHFMENKTQQSVAQKLQIPPFFVRKYTSASRHYSIRKLVDIVGILREFDLKSKGLGNVSSGTEDLQKEMIYKIMH
ncbi:MAG: DNA polymerase III subunit delta [Mangrovibacterium sp.]